MKNTPSALKWMAEKRGRLAHDLAVTQAIAEDVNRRVTALQLDLEAMDRALTIFDSAIVPTDIEPVRANGRYGKRGALREVIVEVLKTHAPAWVATENIEALVCMELGLAFETTTVRKRWYDNSLTKQLRVLVAEGLVERHHDASVHSSEVGRWRWRTEASVLLADL
jgi:hypothetical protein